MIAVNQGTDEYLGRSWANLRLKLKLPSSGHNIPSVNFTDDELGSASTVLAADICGNVVRLP